MKYRLQDLLYDLIVLALFFVFELTLAGSINKLTLAEWSFDQENNLKGWTANTHITEITTKDGALSCRTIGTDPIFELKTPFEITSTPRQCIEVRLKADHSGMAEFFWSNTSQGQYSGFSGNKSTQFQVLGDDQWHVYQLFPFWQTEGKIIRLRFDLFGASRFSIQNIWIVQLPDAKPAESSVFDFTRGMDDWLNIGFTTVSTASGIKVTAESPDGFLLSPPLQVNAMENSFVSIRMKSTGNKASLIFATDKSPGMHRHSFSTIPDETERTYNLDMLAAPEWKGKIVTLGLAPVDDPGASAVVRSLAIAAEPQGPPQLSIRVFGLDEASPRAGVPARITATIANTGGDAATQVRASLMMPDGVRIVTAPKAEDYPEQLAYSEEITLNWTVVCPQPVSGYASLTLSANNAHSTMIQTPISFTALPQLPKASYVPEPKPVRGKYDVGVYYFPGWHSRSQWQPIERFLERKPTLGWYREGDPEVADWHIKWAVEHGITYFAYDWYWSKGARQLEHGLHDGYFNARYKHLLKFCLLWANHNPPKTHSLEDSLAVTRFWITHYFQRPEYYRIDGKPVVIIFSPYNYKNDLGVSEVNRAFEIMRAECRKAGLPGLYLAACVGNARQVEGENYDAVTAYNWPSLGISGTEKQAPYASLIPAYRRQWSQLLKEDSQSVLLPLCGGWDSRPWHGDSALARFGRNPVLFKQHLQDARDFLESNSANSRLLPSVLIEAWNEWGEGSYIEPHKEFGFGYLDAIREVFTGASTEHADLAPVDIGMGPYDLPAITPLKTRWTFDTDSQEWKNTMHLDKIQIVSGALKTATVGDDPALFGPPMQAQAKNYSHVCLKMRLSSSAVIRQKDTAQLFWSTKRWPESEASSLRFPVSVDGQWHEYELPVKDNRRWTGIITRLRLDPLTQSGISLEIQYIFLKPVKTAAASASKAIDAPVILAISDDWQLQVSIPSARFGSNISATVSVTPPTTVTVTDERYDRLPLFNPKAAGWTKGVRLHGVIAQECSTPGLLEPASLILRSSASTDSVLFEPGKDYDADTVWGTMGRLPHGKIAENQPVFASYRHSLLRIDSIVMTAEGAIAMRQGEPRPAAPLPPNIEAGDTRLANVWIPGQITKLAMDNLFPILETAYPEAPKQSPTVAESLLPKTIAKLRQGKPVRILAWGDSVTDGSYIPIGHNGRWQEQFVARLQSRFPNAKIELMTEAWGGRNTTSYLNEPPGSAHNYKEKVLGSMPDLIVSEFVNDAGMNPDQVEQRYSRLLADIQTIGAEWIILTPHYVRPDWMGLSKERDCEEDPRPYVKGLRQFATKHSVALADASLRYGRLWREGIPYNTLMLNSINHPDERGMKIFADALMELFP